MRSQPKFAEWVSNQKTNQKILNESKPHVSQEKVEELQSFISQTKDVREWKVSQSVKLRWQGFSYREIEKRVEVSTSFMTPTLRKYFCRGIAG